MPVRDPRRPRTAGSQPPQQPVSTARAACLDQPEVFHHPLLDEPPARSAPAHARRAYARLEREAAAVCAGCPLQPGCLYDAVVRHDVAGIVAGTTAATRQRIRRRLRISVEPENFDTLAGLIGRHRQVDHAEVVRLRQAHPDESLERLARRLGCSLSTVKRHLRRARAGGSTEPVASRRPTIREVWSAARAELRPARASAA